MRSRLRSAILAGFRFLDRAQSSDGAWRDFQLCGSTSDAWVTAYVTASLDELRPSPTFEEALERGRAYLRGCVREDGWGFNEHAPVDSDSTSWALRALEPTSDAAQAGLRGLLRHQKPDGGFSCFVRFTDASAWTRSHGDISAVALRALTRAGTAYEQPARRCASYLLGNRELDGSWRAFWYTGAAYATLHTLLALREHDAKAIRKGELAAAIAVMRNEASSQDPFPVAHALESAMRFDIDGDDGAALIEMLLDGQKRDGRWTATAPFMKPNPWNHTHDDPDIAVRDQNGIFTTATVLRALGIAYAA